MIGRTVSHYKILSKLGQGGMGEVYLAEDSKLKRKIALKFLPSHLTTEKEATERFKREAQATAAINHPNIVTIYEIAEHKGQTFIAMEYVRGKSLREMMSGKPMSAEKAIEIAVQICEGLNKAHKTGIVHRDIKPENILIDSDGRVKILDFGLVKLQGASQITKKANLVGTINYMAPEQIKDKTIDQRTDIWSLGVVLYEMLTGGLPFKGDNNQAILYAIIRKKPIPIKSHHIDISENLESVILRMIQKAPSSRYRDISELLADLNAIREGVKSKIHHKLKTVGYAKKPLPVFLSVIIAAVLVIFLVKTVFFRSVIVDKYTIAVMNFDNVNRDEDIDWYRHGAAKYLTECLKEQPPLRVLENEDFSHALEDIGIADEEQVPLNLAFKAARKIGAGTLVTGNILKTTHLTKFIINLYDVKDRKFINSEEGNIIEEDELFHCLEVLSQKIKLHLEVTDLVGAFNFERKKYMTRSVEAYKQYILGMKAFYNFDHQQAFSFFSEAIKIDKAFSEVYIPQFFASGNLGGLTLARKSLEGASHALRNGTLRDSLRYEWLDAEIEWDLMRIITSLEQLLILEPYHEIYLTQLGITYNRLNEPQNAIEPLRKAVETRLIPPFVFSQLGWAYHQSKQFEEEEAVYRSGMEIFPDYPWFYSLTAREYYRQKRLKKEKWMIDKLLKKAEENKIELADCYSSLGISYFTDKYFERAISFFLQKARLDSTDSASHIYLAKVYFANEEYEKALEEYLICTKLDTDCVFVPDKKIEIDPEPGQLEEALSYFYACISKYPDGQTRYKIQGTDITWDIDYPR